MKGYIHSKESFGTVDGPGIRYVLFMQGCPMRCRYCHNPDTWEVGSGTEITVDEVMAEYERNRSFYRNGGITVTGGEPLLQIDFLTELFSVAKSKGIHTCIDSSGITYNPANEQYIKKLDRLMEYTDLVMLDIKHIDPQKHLELTGKDNKNILAFARFLDDKKGKLWVRHVVVPGLTDDPVYHEKLGEFLGTLHNLKALDVLPYHTMGAKKYDELGLEYTLKGVEALPKSEAVKAKNTIMAAIKRVRSK